MIEVKGWGESVSELLMGIKLFTETVHNAVLLGCFTFRTCKILSCLVCIVANFKVSLCNCWLASVLFYLSCVYLLYCVCFTVFYFRCRTTC